jgi:hypothetical protein
MLDELAEGYTSVKSMKAKSSQGKDLGVGHHAC